MAWMLRVRVRRGVLTMIGANCFSTILGAILLPSLRDALSTLLPGPPIATIRLLLILLGVASLLLTILLEWPFVWYARTPGMRRWRAALGVSAIVQAVSYAALVPYYLSRCSFSMLTETTLVDRAEFQAQLAGYDAYAVSTDNPVPIRIALDDPHAPTHVLKSTYLGRWPWLFIDVSPDPARLRFGDPWEPEDSDVLRTLDSGAPEVWMVDGPIPSTDDWLAYGQWFESRPADQREWHASGGEWPSNGLRLWHWRRGFRFTTLALATPLEAWWVRSPNALPGDLVIFEAEGQILALHVPTMRIAFLAYGRCPVVVRREAAGQAGEGLGDGR